MCSKLFKERRDPLCNTNPPAFSSNEPGVDATIKGIELAVAGDASMPIHRSWIACLTSTARDDRYITAPWHFVDIALFEGPAHIAERCGAGGCVSEKIPILAANIKANKKLVVTLASGQTRTFTPPQQARFLLHFLGDIHQPLHGSTNADAGGNCVDVNGFSGSSQLHAVWDTALVNAAIKGLANPAKSLITEFQAEIATVMAQTNADAIAGESFGIAKTKVYAMTQPVVVPVIDHFVDVRPSECSTHAPAEIRALHVNGPGSFNNAATLTLVRERVFMAGVRLAVILEDIFQ